MPEEQEVQEPETTGVQEVLVSRSGEEGDRQIKVPFNFGTGLEDLAELYGEQVVYDAAVGLIKINLQAFIRRHLKSEDPVYSDQDILAKVQEWKPGVKISRGKSPIEKAKGLLASLSAEELRELVAAEAARRQSGDAAE